MSNQPIRVLTVAALVACGLLFSSAPGKASVILGYTPTEPPGTPVYDPRFDRFSNDFPTQQPPTPNTMPSFVLAGRDLSGIGWLASNPTSTFAMVTQQHFIAAAHNGLTNFPMGATVNFLDQSNNVISAMVASRQQVPSLGGSPNPLTDILVVKLANPVAGVFQYPIVTGPRSQFLSKPVYMYDQEHRVGLNRVTNFADALNLMSPADTTNTVFHDFDTVNGFNPGETLFTAGDSGGPTFMLAGPNIGLLGDHYGVGTVGPTQVSFDAFLNDYVTAIDNITFEGGAGFHVTTVPVPEPGSLVLLGLTGGVVAWRQFRRRKCPTGAA